MFLARLPLRSACRRAKQIPGRRPVATHRLQTFLLPQSCLHMSSDRVRRLIPPSMPPLLPAVLRHSAPENIRALSGRRPVRSLCPRPLTNWPAGEWTELNDRFFRTLAFGTGGLRGRTIGKVVTNAERGKR